MIHPDIDIFVLHLKHVAKTLRGFDCDCLEDKSEEEALEILDKHFSPEEMRQATLGYVARTRPTTPLSLSRTQAPSPFPHEIT